MAGASRGLYALTFVVSLAACIGILFVKPEWFWVTLPFITTGLAGALDAI